MNDQHQGQTTPETRNPTMSDSWLNRGTRLRRTSPDGGLYIYNALAFSTLLSSQETDAHLRRNLRSLPGQPLNLTLEFLSCQLRFRKLSGRLRSRHCSPSHPKSHPPSVWWPQHFSSTAGTRETSRSRSSVAPRFSARLPAFRLPLGKMNFTADGNPRQIEGPTPVAYRF